MKIAVIDSVKTLENSFLAFEIELWRKSATVRYWYRPSSKDLDLAIEWADVLWVEWCAEQAIYLSLRARARTKRLIIRLHSFEALETEHPGKVMWEEVEALVVVGQDIQDILFSRFPDIRNRTRVHLIYNGIDLERFRPSNNLDMKRIAWVGELDYKKNPLMIVEIMSQLNLCADGFELFVAGAERNQRVVRTLKHALATLCISNVQFCGFVTNIADWYQDKGILLSTSLYESFGHAIGEAAAVGSFPIVFAYPSAEMVWPRQCLFSKASEAVQLILDARPHLFRSFIESRYPRSTTAALISELVLR